MAKRTVQFLIDDIDGGEATGTVEFGIDGTHYTIDLSEENEKKLREALEPFRIKASRKGRLDSNANHRRLGITPAKIDPGQNRAIRDWAATKGLEVSDRGRIKQEIVERYNAEAGRVETTDFIRRQAAAVKVTAPTPAPVVEEPAPAPLDDKARAAAVAAAKPAAPAAPKKTAAKAQPVKAPAKKTTGTRGSRTSR